MSFNVYYNKQAPRNPTENPPTNLGFTQAPQTNQAINNTQLIGIGVATARVLPAGKQVLNTVVQATGDRRLQRNVNRAQNLLGFGVTALTLGLPTAIAVEGIRFIATGIQQEIQDEIDQTNQAYETQKRGVSIKKYVARGERID